jgi:hypothetical protein
MKIYTCEKEYIRLVLRDLGTDFYLLHMLVADFHNQTFPSLFSVSPDLFFSLLPCFFPQPFTVYIDACTKSITIVLRRPFLVSLLTLPFATCSSVVGSANLADAV